MLLYDKKLIVFSLLHFPLYIVSGYAVFHPVFLLHVNLLCCIFGLRDRDCSVCCSGRANCCSFSSPPPSTNVRLWYHFTILRGTCSQIVARNNNDHIGTALHAASVFEEALHVASRLQGHGRAHSSFPHCSRHWARGYLRCWAKAIQLSHTYGIVTQFRGMNCAPAGAVRGMMSGGAWATRAMVLA